MKKPKFNHDCSKCIFLDSSTILGEDVDFYVCENKEHPSITSLLYRTGNDGPDYGSTLAGYVSPLSLHGTIALALYVRHLGANGSNGYFRGTFYKDDKTVLRLKE